MKKISPHLLIIFIGLLSSLGAQPIQRMFVFGDSFSDCGNRHYRTNGIEPGEDYHHGRYTNGQVWIERLSERLGIEVPTCSLTGGTNYAYAGAETKHGIEENGIIHMGSQVDAFLETYETVPQNSLIVLWGGGNDYLSMTPENIVNNLANYTSVFSKAGANEFLILNLPPLEKAPATKELIRRGVSEHTILSLAPDLASWFFLWQSSSKVQSQNVELSQTLRKLEKDLGVHIHQVDIHKLFHILSVNPNAFNIKDLENPAFDEKTKLKVANPDEHAFFDDKHPTSSIHNILALEALHVIQQPVYLLQTLDPAVQKLIQVKLHNPANKVSEDLLRCPKDTSKYLGYGYHESTIQIKSGAKVLADIPLKDLPSKHYFERELDDNTFFFEAEVSKDTSSDLPYILVKLNVSDTLNLPEFGCDGTDTTLLTPQVPTVYATRRKVACNGNDFELYVPGKNTTQRIRGAGQFSCYDVLGSCDDSNQVLIKLNNEVLAQYRLGSSVCHRGYHQDEDGNNYTLYTEIHHDDTLGNYYVHLEIDSPDED